MTAVLPQTDTWPSHDDSLDLSGCFRVLSYCSGFKEGIHFIGNTAIDYGGAISIANADKLNVSDVVFTFNKAEFGGAVGLTSTRWATAKFQRCRFESNKGTSGGALHIDGKGQRTLHDSSFRLNVAGETSSRSVSTLLASRDIDTNTLIVVVTSVNNLHTKRLDLSRSAV